MKKFTKAQLAYGERLVTLGVPPVIALLAMPYVKGYYPALLDRDLLKSTFVWCGTDEGLEFWVDVNDEFIDNLED